MTGISGMTTCSIGSPTCTGVPKNGGEASRRFAEVMATQLGATEALGFGMGTEGKGRESQGRG